MHPVCLEGPGLKPSFVRWPRLTIEIMYNRGGLPAPRTPRTPGLRPGERDGILGEPGSFLSCFGCL